MMKVKNVVHGLFGAVLALTMTSVVAQPTSYPTKPIRFVVGFSAGSSIDLVARVIADKLSTELGETIIVENKSGAAGNIAAGYVAHAAKDGYTLLVVANSIAISPAIYKDLDFDPKKDLAAIAYFGIAPVDLKVNKALKIDTLKDLIAYAKNNPGKLNYSSSGVGGTPHMATVLFEQITGTKLMHIPYKGGGDALAALMGGQVNMLINPLLGNANSDKIKTLAITGDHRSPLTPDVPTFKELGYPEYDVGVYYGIVGPSGMPSEVVEKLNRSVNSVLKNPATIEKFTRSGVVPQQKTAGEFQSFLQQDMLRWQRVVKEGNVSIN
ncbi:MAG: tripartite tricarboxylate transporter substrate binding protein [Proteobacteria bacterium]|jgi:tripartite-type tricarboxylate transporter receptor subunit TctC|nr:tripartite tricarboxylate transporter substrate binding protein [Pseudomonadota bacterium]